MAINWDIIISAEKTFLAKVALASTDAKAEVMVAVL